MLERSYSYVVLRYIHDPLSAEFVNIGVVLVAQASDSAPVELLGRTSHRIRRMRDLWPALDRTAFLDTVNSFDRSLRRAQAKYTRHDLFERDLTAEGIVQSILPHDDSSLRWSPIGTGVARDLNKTFERLFARYVSRYEDPAKQRRSDDEVWRPVRDLLNERNIDIALEPKTIVAQDDTIEFKHAWKNGVWHMYEPLSLDLADADGILEKARRWLGNLTSVRDASEEFRPHFILGAPSKPELHRAFEQAKRVLEKSPLAVKVYEEAEAEQLVEQIEGELAQHRTEVQPLLGPAE